MKYIIRRFFFAVLTTPVVMALYVLAYFAISMMTPYNSGSLYIALTNLPTIGAVYVLWFSFYPQVMRWLTK
jgi:hypothetical protein